MAKMSEKEAHLIFPWPSYQARGRPCATVIETGTRNKYVLKLYVVFAHNKDDIKQTQMNIYLLRKSGVYQMALCSQINLIQHNVLFM